MSFLANEISRNTYVNIMDQYYPCGNSNDFPELTRRITSEEFQEALDEAKEEVQELVEVPVPQPRSAEQLLSAEFLATKKRLEELIHPPAAEQEDNGDHLNMVRMVPVHDEVESVF